LHLRRRTLFVFNGINASGLSSRRHRENWIMKIIVVGHGMVGHKFIENLADGGLQHMDITVLCEEPRPAYDRVHLSEFFAGKSAADLSLVTPGFFERDNLLLKLNAKVDAIDRIAKTVRISSDEVLSYDKLVIATGSYPFVPPVPGKDRKDCFVYRTIEDLEAMRECGNRARTGVVIGGGLLGLECAKALRDMQLETHVVEFSPRLMAVQVDEGGGRVCARKYEKLGVTAHYPQRIPSPSSMASTARIACNLPTAAISIPT